jgi:hypothetical protein
VLENLARKLAEKLPYSEFVPWKMRPGGAARLVYYVNYALYEKPSGLVDVGFFTHLDESQRFLQRARSMDFCVCMSRQYADWLRAQGVKTVAHIEMGFDSYRYRPRLVLGVVGQLDHPRKGKHLVERLRALPFVEVRVSDGRLAEKELPAFYERLDYVLISATAEGGPMSLLEGLAMGKLVIAPEGIGMVGEFGDTEQIRRYKAGDAEALVAVVTACFEEKRRRAAIVNGRSWDAWAEAHHRLFSKLLDERGTELPKPAPGFRFRMMSELDIPLTADVKTLEAAVDQASRHLYYGRYAEARASLETVAPEYPCVRKLIAQLMSSKDQKAGVRGRPPGASMVKPSPVRTTKSSKVASVRPSHPHPLR